MSTLCSKRELTMDPYIGTARAHVPGNYVQWHNCDSNERFLSQVEEAGGKNSRLDDSWGYQFNSYGYRGEDPDPTADKVICVIGCSYTFGEGVTYENTWGNQFKELWQDHFEGERVNLLNLAQGGGANNYIARTVLMQCPKIKPDLLIAQFSYMERREYFDYEHFYSLGSWSEDEYALAFYSFYSEVSGVVKTLLDMLQVQYFCKANGIDYILNFVEIFRLRNIEILEHPMVKPLLAQFDWSHFCTDYIEQAGVKCDNGRDGLHPGPKTNRRFAQKLFEFYIQKENGKTMDTLSISANREVLEFYTSLPFNFYSDPSVAAEEIERRDAVQNYSVIIPLLKDGLRTVDMGCGAGWLVNSLNYHYDVTAEGVDFNPVAIDQASQVSEILKLKSGFHVSDLFQFKPEQPFDLVTSVGVLHHTNACMDGVRHICRHVVSDTGKVFIGLYHTYGRKAFLTYFEDMKQEGASEEELYTAYKALYPGQTDETHLRSWFRDQVLHPHETQHTLEELVEVLSEEGFELESTSINRFEPVEDLPSLFEMEKEYEQIGEQRLDESRYFPGFFVALASRKN